MEYPAEKAYDEVLDEMKGRDSYEWEHVVQAAFKMKERWQRDSLDGGTPDDE